MKKIISIFILTVVFSFVSIGQNCSVDASITGPGVYPTVAEGFKDGFVNTDYEQIIQLRIVLDTVIDIGLDSIAATISYLILDSVVGMPAGFDFNCNNLDCKIKGGEIGCAKMFGKPSLEDGDKTFNLTIHGTLNGVPKLYAGTEFPDQSFPIEFSGYSLRILPEINSVTIVNAQVASSIYPNPALNSFTLEMNSFTSENVKINIKNAFGALVKSESLNLISGLNTLNIETSDFNSGLYVVSLESSFGVVIHKLMVK